MKSSEVALVALLNRNNAMNIEPERLTFGKPRVSPGVVGSNTVIEVSAVADDKQYNREMVFNYNRRLGTELGLIQIAATREEEISDLLAAAITDRFNLATDVSDFICRTRSVLAPNILSLIYDFCDHPLIYGYVTVKVTLPLPEDGLDDVVETNVLLGFTPEQLN
jgi:hypothetical protein